MSSSSSSSSSSSAVNREPQRTIGADDSIGSDDSIHYKYPPEKLSDFIIKLNPSSDSLKNDDRSPKEESNGKKKDAIEKTNEGKNDAMKEEGSSPVVYYHVHKSILALRSKYFETLFQEAKERNEILKEMDLLEGMNTSELLFKDYLSHVYFASRNYTTLTNDNLLHFLHLCRHFEDTVLYNECRSLLFSGSFEQSSAFPINGWFDLVSFARQYRFDALKERCMKKLKDSDCMTSTLNKIHSEHLSSSSSSSSSSSEEASLLSFITGAESLDHREIIDLLNHYHAKTKRIVNFLDGLDSIRKSTLEDEFLQLLNHEAVQSDVRQKISALIRALEKPM